MSDATVSEPHPSAAGDRSWASRGLAWIDRWCERIGDTVNPILVKEARQALKSRQFVFTFSALLLGALGWTIIGSLSMMPQIYTSPSAPRMLIGYYFVLAVPMMFVVPVAAYRSLEAEIDDGTLELLSISALSPWQIVLGKLYSALLQMTLYFVALFPCVAYAYNLRGVDLPTTLIIMSALLVAAVMLTIFGLFLAANASSRTGRIASLFVVMGGVLAVQISLGEAVVRLINEGNPLSGDELFVVITTTVVLAIGLGHLMLATAAAHLTPESENRSTTVRISLLILTASVVGLMVLAGATLEYPRSTEVILPLGLALAVLWTFAGSIIVSESPVQTPRIRRELPQSFLARCLLTWITPGPASGLVFTIVPIVILSCVGGAVMTEFTRASPRGMPLSPMPVMVGFAAYLSGFLIMTRVIVAIVRTQVHVRAEIGVVVLILIATLSALVPYSIGLHLNDYRDYDYSLWQLTNWIWSLYYIAEGNRADGLLMIVSAFSGLAFCGAVVWSADVTLPRRIATPARVLAAEQDRA